MPRIPCIALAALIVFGCSQKYFTVESSSMEPTIPKGARVRVDLSAYDSAPVARDDLVCFTPGFDPDWRFVFRVVGLPGDTITIEHDSLYLNGRPLGWGVQGATVPVTLGADEYYVLGDNKDDALDSRYLGPITRDQIEGKVVSVNPPAVASPVK